MSSLNTTTSTIDALRQVIVCYQQELHAQIALLEDVAKSFEQPAAYWRKRVDEATTDLSTINRLAAAAQEGEH